MKKKANILYAMNTFWF